MLNGRKPGILQKLGAVEVVGGHVRGGKLVRPYLREREPTASGHKAKGIPDRRVVTPVPEVTSRRVWEFGVHDHHADRAGRHFDLRLGDPATGIAHSWALPKSRMPEPGEKLLAVMQPDHTVEYMDFKGRIAEGYGKGRVDLHARDKVEVLYASEDRVRFNRYEGRTISEYVLVRMADKQWLVMNVTPVRTEGLPDSKPSYRSMQPDDIPLADDGQVLQAKVDGAHVLVEMRPGKQTRVFSYRKTARKTGIIDHTWRLEKVIGHKAPPRSGHTILRGEVYAKGSDGVALPAAEVGGLLNSGVWKSRDKQRRQGKLDLVVFDVIKHRGRSVEDKPYSEKLDMIAQHVAAHSDVLALPATAITATAKKALHKKVMAGDHPQTKEGFIVWDLDRPTPTKAKIRDDHDVFVRGVFRAYGKDGGTLDRAGGFSFSWEPNGPVVGRVGSGFDHETLRAMQRHPKRFVGKVAKVRSPERLPSGALLAPSFSEWHLDKGSQGSA